MSCTLNVICLHVPSLPSHSVSLELSALSLSIIICGVIIDFYCGKKRDAPLLLVVESLRLRPIISCSFCRRLPIYLHMHILQRSSTIWCSHVFAAYTTRQVSTSRQSPIVSGSKVAGRITSASYRRAPRRWRRCWWSHRWYVLDASSI